MVAVGFFGRPNSCVKADVTGFAVSTVLAVAVNRIGMDAERIVVAEKSAESGVRITCPQQAKELFRQR
ncbi:MAG: hypothetical protein ACJAVI_002718 [Candidatus Azotimanducaceae bacterium]|jgi:hypothetical protein